MHLEAVIHGRQIIGIEGNYSAGIIALERRVLISSIKNIN